MHHLELQGHGRQRHEDGRGSLATSKILGLLRGSVSKK